MTNKQLFVELVQVIGAAAAMVILFVGMMVTHEFWTPALYAAIAVIAARYAVGPLQQRISARSPDDESDAGR